MIRGVLTLRKFIDDLQCLHRFQHCTDEQNGYDDFQSRLVIFVNGEIGKELSSRQLV